MANHRSETKSFLKQNTSPSWESITLVPYFPPRRMPCSRCRAHHDTALTTSTSASLLNLVGDPSQIHLTTSSGHLSSGRSTIMQMNYGNLAQTATSSVSQELIHREALATNCSEAYVTSVQM